MKPHCSILQQYTCIFCALDPLSLFCRYISGGNSYCYFAFVYKCSQKYENFDHVEFHELYFKEFHDLQVLAVPDLPASPLLPLLYAAPAAQLPARPLPLPPGAVSVPRAPPLPLLPHHLGEKRVISRWRIKEKERRDCFNQRYTEIIPMAPFSLVLRKEYFDGPQRDSHAVHYIYKRGERGVLLDCVVLQP
jgi:hypothetical protein